MCCKYYGYSFLESTVYVLGDHCSTIRTIERIMYYYNGEDVACDISNIINKTIQKSSLVFNFFPW